MPHKIGVDARLLYYRKGGIPEYTRQLLNAYAELDTENHYVVVEHRRDPESYCPAPNFRRVNALTPAHHRLEKWSLSAEMVRHHLDLFHSPDFIAPIHAARRHVITIHDLHFMVYPHFQAQDGLAYYQGQIHQSAQRADHILVQTESTKQEVMALLNVPADKITVHLLGVHADFKPLALAEIQAHLAPYNLPADYMLFVGTIEPRKNIPNLLKAYALLRERYPDMPRLVLGGQAGWHVEQEIANLDILQLREHVTWIQGVPIPDLPALYAGAKLLILPSFHEGFGMPAIEAMACGTPVVVANTGALPEVVGEVGVYIDPHSAESIAEGILRLLNDSELYARLQREGLHHAARYTWRHTAEIALQVYHRVLET